nr:MAG TPA: hypothetical protein [Caudoviricetes sp.]
MTIIDFLPRGHLSKDGCFSIFFVHKALTYGVPYDIIHNVRRKNR